MPRLELMKKELPKFEEDKELVKRFHPDANGGDRSREGRLQEILKAYQTLKSNGLA